MPSPWSSANAPACPVCHQMIDARYLCPPCGIYKCYECLIGCKEFISWTEIIDVMDMVPGYLDVEIWGPMMHVWKVQKPD